MQWMTLSPRALCGDIQDLIIALAVEHELTSLAGRTRRIKLTKKGSLDRWNVLAIVNQVGKFLFKNSHWQPSFAVKNFEKLLADGVLL